MGRESRNLRVARGVVAASLTRQTNERRYIMDFYKITNEKERHNGMQYKGGMNVDIIPFNPSGTCTRGGIYFSREDILAFIDYGPWIRKVTIPEGEKIYENPREPKKWKAHKVILGERQRIDEGVVKMLLEAGADVHAHDDGALYWAAENGCEGVVKILKEAMK